MISPTMITAVTLFLSLLLPIAASVAGTETEDVFVLDQNRDSASTSGSPLMLLAIDKTKEKGTEKSSSMLRGGTSTKNPDGSLEFPPLPPIHPHHTGSVHYSSTMNSDGTTSYRRDINAPCDYGMLVFNIGPAKDNMPYKYDLYADAYLWSDNESLCMFYPSYTGFQISNHGPYWKLGYDPMTVNFGDLSKDFRHMHRISSRILSPVDGSAQKNANAIDKNMAGDYIIMAHHNFYTIEYYKELKQYVNSWRTEEETGKNQSTAFDTFTATSTL